MPEGSTAITTARKHLLQADAAGDANAQIAALERLQGALAARDEVASRIASLDQVLGFVPVRVAPLC